MSNVFNKDRVFMMGKLTSIEAGHSSLLKLSYQAKAI